MLINTTTDIFVVFGSLVFFQGFSVFVLLFFFKDTLNLALRDLICPTFICGIKPETNLWQRDLSLYSHFDFVHHSAAHRGSYKHPGELSYVKSWTKPVWGFFWGGGFVPISL